MFSRYNSRKSLGIWGEGSIVWKQTWLTAKKCSVLANINNCLLEMDLNQRFDSTTPWSMVVVGSRSPDEPSCQPLSLCKGSNQTHKSQGLSVKRPNRHGDPNNVTCMEKDSFVLKHANTKTVKEMYCRSVLLPFQIISVECILWALATFLHYWWIKLSLFKGSNLVTHEYLQMLLKKALMVLRMLLYIQL